VIQDLPSSQILLRYLPTQVTAFTPFVAPSAAPPLADKLAAWQDAAVGILREAVPAWLAGLQSVADVWRVRRVVSDVLGDAQFEAQIATALEAEWGARVQAIWTAKLDALVVNAGETLRTASRSIRAGRDKVDNDPEAFMFSDIAFPSVAGVTGTSTAFNSLLGTLRKRTAFRTPLLDSVLSSLESAAASIKDDLADLPEPLLDDYRAKIVTALDALVKAFSDVLADAGGHRDATGSVEAEMFVGRVALYLIHTSSFLPDLNLPGVDLGELSRSSANKLTEQSLSRRHSWTSTRRPPSSGRA
jgi:hypothetical protein